MRFRTSWPLHWRGVNSTPTSIAYVALGSNLPSLAGDSCATLCAAIDELDAVAGAGSVVARSSLYQTLPVGYKAQPAFVNAVVALETRLAPLDLLDLLLGIEQHFGRDRGTGERNGPRTLDLDLLLYGCEVLAGPRLTLPHPALEQRRFVLAPLAEVAPRLPHPTLHWTIAELLAALPDQGENSVSSVRRLAAAPVLSRAAR